MTTRADKEAYNVSAVTMLVAVATIGGFMFGYDSGVINGTQQGLEAAFSLSDLGTGLNVGAILVGCAIGAFVAGRLADIIGRRRVMMLAAVLFIVSALAAGAAESSVVFIIARLVGGLGVGAASVISPVYISEVVPAHVRGRLSSVQQVMIITGLTGAFVVNYAFARVAGASTASFWFDFPAWRWMFWAQVIPATIYLLALLTIPESPRWLILKQRDAEAQAILERLFGRQAATLKVGEIRGSLATDLHRPRFSDLLNGASGGLRTVVWAGIGLAVFQQLVGINVVFYYGAVLWQSVGFTESDALQINILIGVVSIIACLAAMTLIDRWGRRPLLLTGSLIMAGALATMAYCFAEATTGTDGAVSFAQGQGAVALGSALVFVTAFNFSWGPVMWVMLGEMFPNQIRGSSLALAGFAQWAANFATTVLFPLLAATLGLSGVYLIYAAGALSSFGFVLLMVSETKGRELEAMTA